MSKIISTVGTSIFENFFQMDENAKHKDLPRYKELKKQDLPYASWDQQKSRIDALRNVVQKNMQVLSAEIASILAIQQELNQEITVHLLATDTILSVLAAELIKAWFEQEENRRKYPDIKEVHFEKPDPGFQDQKKSDYVIKDLRISEQEEYERGVLNLLDVLNRISKKDSILNITGGYKSIIPIITIWSQLEQLEIKYIFNESEIDKKIKPISLPGLPINFDWEIAQCVTQYLSDKILKAQDSRNPFFNESLDDEVFQMLKKWKLISVDGRRTTPLANLLKVFVEKRSMVSRDSVLGLMMEYKYYEYFNEFSPDYEKPTKGTDFGCYFWNDDAWSEDELIQKFNFNRERLSLDIRDWNRDKTNDEDRILKTGDFDLIFKKKNSEEVGIGEVKALKAFDHTYKYKVWHRILAFQKKHNGISPNAYVLLLYNVKFQYEPPKDYARDKSLLEKLKAIGGFINNRSNVAFSVFICDINLSSKSFKIHYDELLRHPILPREIKMAMI